MRRIDKQFSYELLSFLKQSEFASTTQIASNLGVPQHSLSTKLSRLERSNTIAVVGKLFTESSCKPQLVWSTTGTRRPSPERVLRSVLLTDYATQNPEILIVPQLVDMLMMAKLVGITPESWPFRGRLPMSTARQLAESNIEFDKHDAPVDGGAVIAACRKNKTIAIVVPLLNLDKLHQLSEVADSISEKSSLLILYQQKDEKELADWFPGKVKLKTEAPKEPPESMTKEPRRYTEWKAELENPRKEWAPFIHLIEYHCSVIEAVPSRVTNNMPAYLQLPDEDEEMKGREEEKADEYPRLSFFRSAVVDYRPMTATERELRVEKISLRTRKREEASSKNRPDGHDSQNLRDQDN